MQIEKVNLNIQHLSIWLTATQGLVFHQGHKSLYMLEPLSLALLFALDEGINEQQTIAELQQHSPLTSEQIAPSLKQVKALMVNNQIERTYADGLYPELQGHLPQHAKADDFTIKVANSTFAITCQDKQLLKHITDLLAPIALQNEQNEQNEQGQENPVNQTIEVDFLLEIEHQNNIYTLYSNDQAVEENLSQNQVMPVLIDRLQILGYQQSDYTFGFHGAALTKAISKSKDPDLRQDDEGDSSRHSVLDTESPSEAQKQEITLLLPGVSGAGKSTLTAELSKLNYQVYSDEIIAINNDLSLNVLALPMAIKSGSWQHIAKLYPEIETQPEWHRIDGRILKYIWPEQIAKPKSNEKNNNNGAENNDCRGEFIHLKADTATTDEISHNLQPGVNHLTPNNKTLLISPKYQANTKPQTTPLSIIDTIALVTDGGYQLGAELTEHRVGQLIEFCKSISAYQITYANSEQSLAIIKQLINEN
ncbi:hypothetical protein AADZ86_02840 [Colwelliaceae bacterium BS250]